MLDLGDNRRLGEVYAGMAYLLGSEGDYAAASQRLRALTIATSLEWQDLQISTSIGLGRVYSAQGNYQGAIERMSLRSPARSRTRTSVGARASSRALTLARELGMAPLQRVATWASEATSSGSTEHMEARR